MMKLSSMRKVDATVGADRSSPIAEAILSNWKYDPGTIRWFRSSANFIYQFQKGGQTQYLRFIETSERGKEQIEEETHLVQWLAQAGVHVAAPVPSRVGNIVETVATDVGTFHAVVFEGLDGDFLDISELDEAQFRTWGASLGKLHAAVRSYESTSTQRRSWKDHITTVATYIPQDEHNVLYIEWKRIYDWANSLPVHPENFGLIHYDFELDNLCWHENTVGILDFDDCAYYWYAADIAFALRDLFDDGADEHHPAFQSFVAGYRDHVPLDDALLAQIPMFLRMHRLVMCAKLIRCMDVPRDELPSWLAPLNDKLTNWVTSYRNSLK